MQNDPLRTGVIFKLKPKELERVRSPPVVKFNVPAAEKPPQPVNPTKDIVRESFLEIYRQTPVPKSAANRSSATPVDSPYWRSPSSSYAPAVESRQNNYHNDYADSWSMDNYRDEVLEHRGREQSKQPQLHSMKAADSSEINRGGALVTNAAPSSSSSARSSTASNNEQPSHTRQTDPVAASTRVISAQPAVNRAPTASSSLQPPRIGTAVAAGRSVSAHPRAGSSRAQAADSLFLLVAGGAARPRSVPRPAVAPTAPTPVAAARSAPPAPTSVARSVAAAQSSSDSERESTGNILKAAAATATTGAKTTAPSHRLVQGLVPPVRSTDTEARLGGSEDDPDVEEVPARRKRGRPPKSASQGAANGATANRKTLSTTGAGAKGRASVARGTTRRRRSDSASDTDSSSASDKGDNGRANGSDGGSGSAESSDRDSAESDESAAEQPQRKVARASGGNRKGRSAAAGHDGEVVKTRSGRQSVPKKVIPLLVEEERERRAEQKPPPRRGRPPKSVTSPNKGTIASGTTEAGEEEDRPSSGTKGTTSTATIDGKSGRAPSTKRQRPAQGQGQSSSSSAAHSAAYNLHTAVQEIADETGWTPSEKVALFNVQTRLDRRAPDYWEVVSDALMDLGIEKSAEQCQRKWYEKLEDTKQRQAKRKQLLQQKQSQSQPEQGSKGSTTAEAIEGSGTVTGPAAVSSGAVAEIAKPKRMTKAVLKRMAQESTRATHEDDIFDTDAMRSTGTSNANNHPSGSGPGFWPGPEDSNSADESLRELLAEGFLDELDLPHEAVPVTAAQTGNAGRGRGGAVGQIDGMEQREEDGIVFESSHVHKLQYKPSAPRLGLAKGPAGRRSSGVGVGKSTKAGAVKASGGGVGKLINARTGKVNTDLVRRQAVAAVRGSGSAGTEESFDEGEVASVDEDEETDSQEEEQEDG